MTKLAADATTADASKNFWFLTSANSKATALSDIVGAEAGVVYKIEIGSVENATTIAKSGKFENLKSAWNPEKVGAWIKVVYDKETEKFKEVERN